MHPADASPLLSPAMATWEEFAAAAAKIAEIFVRRHAAAGGLCMLATLRPDGFPRISPMEPRIFEGTLWIGGMPGTAKFRDLVRRPAVRAAHRHGRHPCRRR